MSLGSSILVAHTQTAQLSLPAIATSSDGSGEEIGEMTMADLDGMGGDIFTSTANENMNVKKSGNASDSVALFVEEGATRFGPDTVNGGLRWTLPLEAVAL